MQELSDRNHDALRLAPVGSDAPREKFSELDRLVAAARRQLWVVAVSCLIAVLLGIGYLVNAAPQFTASAALLIDHRKVRAVQDAYDVTHGDMAGSAVDSQVELLKSDKIAFSLIDKLHLHRDPEILHPRPGLVSQLVSTLKGQGSQPKQEPLDTETARLNALYWLRGGLDVRRVQRTLVLEIRFRSTHPHKAATIANAFADAYLMDHLDSKYEATRRASGWLLDRIAELKQRALTSDLAIQKFKADNDLISTGGTGGKLVNEQQLGEVNSQLVTARAETAKAEARYARIKAIIDNRQTDAVVTEAIGNNIIEQLRTKFLGIAKREAELAIRLGPTHGVVAGLRTEMREYERLMFDELGRIAESYLSDLVIAQTREKSLRSSLEGLVGVNASANETAVALRELEREAETYRTLYQTFLQRYQEAVQQQSFPITEARVITSALTPTGQSHPRRSIVLVVSLLLGGAAGVGIGLLRELLDRAYRTEEQVRQELGLEFLGTLPAIESAGVRRWLALPQHLRIAPGPHDLMRQAIDNPLSNYAETLRAIKIAADLTLAGRTPRTIGIVSVLPGEGKTTVAKNLASLLAHQGARTILIDADLRNPGLTRRVAPKADVGLLQAGLDGRPLQEVLLHEEDSKLAILPVVLQRRLPHASEFLASPGMKTVLKQAEQDFDWIVLDLSPLGPVVDARAIAPQVDAFVFVVEWGRTARRLVRTALQTDWQIRDKCLGIVFNKVDMKQLKLYEADSSKSYYSAEYSNYYSEGGAPSSPPSNTQLNRCLRVSRAIEPVARSAEGSVLWYGQFSASYLLRAGGRLLVQPFEAVLSYFAECRRAEAAKELYQQLSRLSDAELARSGLKRGQLAQFIRARLYS